MDFLKVSDKTATPCKSDYSLFGLNQQQYKESSLGFGNNPHPHVIAPCNKTLFSLLSSLLIDTLLKTEHNEFSFS